MDRVKQAFVALVQEMIEVAVEEDMPPVAEEYEEYNEQVSFEFQQIDNLTVRVRINQGPYRGPRYFEVSVKETYLCGT